MNKKILIAGLLVSVILLVPINSAYSNIGIQVDKNLIIPTSRGNILYVGGNGSGNYSKIQDAIDDASDGDTVFVYDDSSPYYQYPIINKSINLIGEDKNTTFINGNNNRFHVIEIIEDRVNISGFSIFNGGAGIFVDNTSSNVIISDNHIIGCHNGIFLRSDDMYGINEIYIISNSFKKFIESAIYIDGSFSWNENITISDNIIISTSKSIVYELTGDITLNWGGRNLKITNNTVIRDKSNELRNGLFLRGVRDSIIEGNKFSGYNNGNALDLYGSSYDNIISHNNFTNNSCSILFKLSSFPNKIINNNFINNEFDTLSAYYSFKNRWDGNYWDTWIGLKYKLPIFQRFPKIIRVSFFGFAIDWHPASDPYDI